MKDHGMDIDAGCYEISVVNNWIRDAYGPTLQLLGHTDEPGDHDITIQGNVLIQESGAAGASGLYLAAGGTAEASGITAVGNVIITNSMGMRIIGSGNYKLKQVTVANNVIYSSSTTQNAIHVGENSGCEDVNLEGNVVIGGYYGINILSNCLDVRVIGNIVRDTAERGIYASSRALIANNQVKNFNGIGICVNADEVVVSNNVVDGRPNPSGQSDGIRSETGRNRVLIIGNYVSYCRTNGIWVRSNTGTRVIGNVVVNNSQRGAGSDSGIYISDSQYVLVQGNLCTDTQATKTQKYGINESGTSDYNFILDNDLRNNLTGPLSKVGANTVVKNNVGYDTENFKATNKSVTVGTGGTYGSATTITTPSGRVTYPRVKITWGGTFGTDETVTVKVEAVYSDGSTAYVEKSASATGSLWLTDDDVLTLVTQGKDIVKLNVYAKTNLASTSVTVTVDAYGKA
jgi:hypothetical protein